MMPDLFVNKLTVIDFSFLDPIRGLVGESWQANIILKGSLDQQGMLLDFGHVKKIIKTYIDDNFDHKLFIPNSKNLKKNIIDDSYMEIEYIFNEKDLFFHKSPLDAIVEIESEKITTAKCEKAISVGLLSMMPDNISELDVKLIPEHIDKAYYHYSHGLKNHDGNCQRIAHGHRSKIIIKRNNKRDEKLEAEWAEKFKDIYIGSHEDLLYEDNNQMVFQYDGSMGTFFLKIPSRKCYLINKDTTVENIAQHIAEKLKINDPKGVFQVFAFEGIDKGAIAKN